MSSKERIGVYAGTFDPLTSGHISIVRRALSMFDKIIIAVARETNKNTLFTLEERVNLVKASFPNQEKIIVEPFDGLLVNFAVAKNACALVRGLRAVSDFEYELQLALMNRKLCQEIETVFLMSSFQWMYISSTIVKSAASLGGNVHGLVSEPVLQAFRKKYNHPDSWSSSSIDVEKIDAVDNLNILFD